MKKTVTYATAMADTTAAIMVAGIMEGIMAAGTMAGGITGDGTAVAGITAGGTAGGYHYGGWRRRLRLWVSAQMGSWPLWLALGQALLVNPGMASMR